MSYAPFVLVRVQEYLKAKTGLPAVSLGIIGDQNHEGGYHSGWDGRRIRNGQTDDYSWSHGRDLSHKSNAARALDIGNHNRLRELSTWIVQQAVAGAPDTRDLREVIYSPDGKVVRRWDRLGRSSTGDSSHLTHTHLSWFADSENRAKLALFARFYEGNDDVALSNEDVERVAERVWARVNPSVNLSYSQIIRGAATRTQALEIKSAIASFMGLDVTAVVRAEFQTLASMLTQVIREEITDASEDQIERVFRRVFGSLDNEVPAGSPPGE